MSTITPERPSSTVSVAPPSTELAPWRLMLWGVFAVAAVLGSVGVAVRLLDGHLPAGYGSYVPWGLWVAVYSLGVGIAGGAFAIAALLYLFKVPGFASPKALRVATVLVAASLLPALLAVGFDLGRMERAWRLLATPSFSSLITFNTWTYIALLLVCGAIWWLTHRPDRGWIRPLTVLGLLLAVMAPSQGGAFFGVVVAKPHWAGSMLPLLVLVSSLTAGAAVLLLVRALVADGERDLGARWEALDALRTIRWVVLVGLAAYAFLEFAEMSTALWDPQAEAAEVRLVLTGPYWWAFWIVHVGLGGVLAGALLLARRPRAWVVAGALVGASFLTVRLNLIIPPQTVSELPGLEDAFVHPRLAFAYQATAVEYLVALFCLALAMAIFYVGVRLSAFLEGRVDSKEATHVAQ